MKAEIEGGAEALPHSQNDEVAAREPHGLIETKKRYFKENIL